MVEDGREPNHPTPRSQLPLRKLAPSGCDSFMWSSDKLYRRLSTTIPLSRDRVESTRGREKVSAGITIVSENDALRPPTAGPDTRAGNIDARESLGRGRVDATG
jgi:hypothetical protein